MTDVSGATVLRAAADYITVHGHTRHCMTNSAGAVCAAGAIRAVAPPGPGRRVSAGERAALVALAAYLGLKPCPGDSDPLAAHPATLVTHWNDHVARDGQQVATAMRAAAENASSSPPESSSR